METFSYYETLLKPSWAPSPEIFGPVWTILYLIIGASFGYVFFRAVLGRLPWKYFLPFGLNLILNLVYTPIQFGLQNELLAAVDILLVLVTLVWAIVSIYPRIRWVALINLPYLAWVLFATALQFTITYLNY